MASKKRSRRASTPDTSRSGTSRSDTRRKERAPRGTAPVDVRIPGWLPWALFGLLTLILFHAFVFSDDMLVGGDTLSLGYVARSFYADALHRGIFPLWAPRLLGGTPFVEALAGGDSLYPPSLLLLMALETHRALGWKLVLHVFAAGLLMFGWVRSLGASRAAALVAGTGYLLSPMLIGFVRPGHDGKLFVMALAPLMFWAVERFFSRPRLGSFAGVALVVALVILTTHFQMAWFLFMAVGAYALFRAVQVARGAGVSESDARGTARPVAGANGGEGEGPEPDDAAVRGSGWSAGGLRFALFLVAAVVGAAGAAVQLLPAVEYVTGSSRRIQTTRAEAGETGLAWSSSYSIHPEEAMSILIPEFSGNNAGEAAWAQGSYWGRNGFKDNHESPGLVLLFLAAFAFAGGRRRGVRFFMAGLAAVAFLFALGTHTPVWRIFYEVVPGIRLFRAPSQAMFLVSLAAATVAGLGVDRILRAAREADESAWTLLLRVAMAGSALLACGVLLAASGALTSLWTSVVYRGMAPYQLQMLQALEPVIVRGAFLSALLVGAAATVVWALRKGFASPVALVAGLTLLVALDPLRIDPIFVQTMDFEAWAQPDPTTQAVLDLEAGRDEPYRLLSFAQRGQDVQPSLHGIELAGGHHPNDLSRYRELIGMVGSEEPDNLYDDDIRRLLNVRYIVWPDAETGQAAPTQGVIARSQFADGQVFQTLLGDAGLPRARLVSSAVVRPDDQAVAYMLSEAFDPQREVVLTEPPPLALPGGAVDGDVTWVTRSPNRLELRVRSRSAALLVVADNWFPAWQATVDGADAPVLRAYHTLRAVPVEAGEHTVVMEYHSALLAGSAWLSAFVLLGLLAALIVGLMRDRSTPRGAAGEGS